LADATCRYLVAQQEAGAQILQLFDTWLSEMPRWFFKDHYLPILNSIFEVIRSRHVPSIYFSKNSNHLLPDFQELKTDVLSVDSGLSLTEIEQKTSGRFSLQGNLDPLILFCSEGVVHQRTRELVSESRKLNRPPIMNLAHGVLPETPVENVRAFF